MFIHSVLRINKYMYDIMLSDTVNSEIFARVYFCETFVEIKPSRNLLVTNVGNSCPSREFFNVANISFNAIRENETLSKISEFTVMPDHRP